MSALSASADVFETFFDAASVGLALADLSTRYVRVNARYADLVGKPPEDLIGLPFSGQLHPDDRAGADNRASVLLAGGASSMQSEQRYLCPDGSLRWVLHGVTIVPDKHGTPAWFAVSAQDITERRQAEDDLRRLTDRLAEQAVRDPLTGLANRLLFEDRLRAVLARGRRTGERTGVLYLDLDGFKAINDEHGHQMGDLVLQTVALRLRAAMRPSDTVARLGGDEFVVLVEGATESALHVLAGRLRAGVAEPMPIQSLDVNVGVSVGVALSAGPDEQPAALLARADRSMYDVKRSGQAS